MVRPPAAVWYVQVLTMSLTDAEVDSYYTGDTRRRLREIARVWAVRRGRRYAQLVCGKTGVVVDVVEVSL